MYPESIFDKAHTLLQQFELESSGCNVSGSDVTLSSLLTLDDFAASAVIAVALTAMNKVSLLMVFLTFSDTIKKQVLHYVFTPRVWSDNWCQNLRHNNSR